MKIGILNTGNIGSRLAGAWAAADHELMLAKDGDARKMDPLLAELRGRVRPGSIKEAAEFGDALLFSVYWPRADAIIHTVGDSLDGKVVIETSQAAIRPEACYRPRRTAPQAPFESTADMRHLRITMCAFVRSLYRR
ncbi:NADPH-dependent F420 reductase [Cupriavidus sp. D384]|uniref:NADPH-dependent F420 reductase n=1 Tax=Cupriavidus sp. D384 TaxID=1538095 RepID=UPI0009EE677E|nr:NAD(P)-binding domain-containing protein [Cupriavidus sp. D384]